MDVNSSPTLSSQTPQLQSVEWIDPRDILHPSRLDIAVKANYANALLGRPSYHSDINAEESYLRHILFRTGGKEPGDEMRKGTLTAFKQEFIALIDSMQRHGFNADYAIPVSRRTGLILNGAHRLAAALALGLPHVPIIYQDDVDGLTWDTQWFINQGFSPTEVDEFVRIWISLRHERAGCIILWSPIASHWAEIENSIQTATPIVYSRTIELPAHAFAELMRDIYVTDWGPIPGDNIERKIKFLSDYPTRLRFLVVAQQDPALLVALKNKIRDQWHHLVPTDRFATLHTTDTERETAYIADLLLNRANLSALLHRPATGLRPAFLAWLAAYHTTLQTLGIDPESCCVVGSSVLEAFGLREATDVDFTVTHQLREALFTPGVTHLTPNLDVVSLDYPRAKPGKQMLAPSDDDLIRDRALHVRVRGLKFAALDVVVARKQTQRRFKDLMDVALASKRQFELME